MEDARVEALASSNEKKAGLENWTGETEKGEKEKGTTFVVKLSIESKG